MGHRLTRYASGRGVNRNALERMLESRMIEEVHADDDEISALWHKAIESYRDSAARGISRDGAFKLLYDAGRQAATAIVTAHGYRAKGALGHHYSVLAAGAALAHGDHADLFKQMDLERGRRHEIEYSAYSEIDNKDIEQFRDLVRSLINETASALRGIRPNIRQRIHKVR